MSLTSTNMTSNTSTADTKGLYKTESNKIRNLKKKQRKYTDSSVEYIQIQNEIESIVTRTVSVRRAQRLKERKTERRNQLLNKTITYIRSTV